MSELLVIATGLIVCVAAGRGVPAIARPPPPPPPPPPLCPAVIFAPMLVYIYSWSSLTLISSGSLPQFFPDPGRVDFVLTINLLAIIAFCAGLQRIEAPVVRGGGRLDEADAVGPPGGGWCGRGSPSGRSRSASSSAWSGRAGPGLWTMAKPFLSSPIDSGYYRELPNLAFPAAFLVALGWGGRA